MQKPKGEDRCIHCGQPLVEETDDHVFPASWYPDSTPQSVQRWKAPSCRVCNGTSGKKEQELFIRLALCVDPRKIEAHGISSKLARTFGIGEGISPADKQKRTAFRDRILSEAKPISEENQAHIIPGLGPHPGFPIESQREIGIPAQVAYDVAKKIVRGCEFWFLDGRIIDPPYKLDVYMVHPEEIPGIVRMFDSINAVTLGPGFRVRRAAVREDPLSAMYQVEIWGTWTLYFTVLPPEDASPEEANEESPKPSATG
jgi:hypothetical protein